MRSKVIRRVIAGALICTLLAGCGKNVDGLDTNSILQGVVSSVDGTIPKSVKKDVSKNLILDADIIAPEKLPQIVRVYRGKPAEFNNFDAVLQTFFPKGDYTKEIDREAQSTLDGKKQWYNSFTSPDTSGGETTSVGFSGTPASQPGKDAVNLSGASSIYGIAPLGDRIFQISSEYTNIPGAAQRIRFSDRDLPFMSQEDAEKKCRDLLDKLKVPIHKTLSRCLVWSHTDAQMQQDALKKGQYLDEKDLIKDFTQEDDSYTFKFYNEIDGGIVADFLGVSKGMDDSQAAAGSTITMVYGKNGIAAADIQYIYQPTGKAEKEGKPVGFEEALNQAVRQLNATVSTYVTTITKIEFAYAPRRVNHNTEEVLLRPAWIFEYHSTSTSSEGDRQILVDALTGKEMK